MSQELPGDFRLCRLPRSVPRAGPVDAVRETCDRARAAGWATGAARAITRCMTLDIPDQVRNKVVAEGNASWLDGLPSVVESLAQDWSLTIGATLRGGHAAFVVEATFAGTTAAVLK